MRNFMIPLTAILLSLNIACKNKTQNPSKVIYTKLHMAVRERDTERIKQLIESGEDVNVKNKNSVPPIAFAINEGSLKMVKLFVEGGADLSVRVRTDFTLLHLAVDNNQTNISKYLIQKGLSINAVNDNGTTPLHLAAKNGNVELIKTFLQSGADPNAKNNFKQTPLHLAVHSRVPEALKLLIQAGADINAADYRENRPLHLAAARNQATIKILLDNNAEINPRNKIGMTPLAIANYMERNHIPENWEEMNSTFLRNNGGIVEEKPVYVWKAKSRTPLVGTAVYKFNIEKNNYKKIGLTNEEGKVPYTELYGQNFFDFCLIYDGQNTSPTLELKHPAINEMIEAKPFNVNHWPALRLEANIDAANHPIE